MDQYICPHKLQVGDKVIFVTPSGAIEPQFVEDAGKLLQEWRLNVCVALHALMRAGRYCGTIEERLDDLQQAMDDPQVKAIFCSRGGSGIIHLLTRLRFEEMRKYPKWIIGYSDITALHALAFRNGLLSLHAPMAKHLSEDAQSDATRYLRQALFEENPVYEIAAHSLNRMGDISGRLVGGNLAVLCSLLGTPCLDIPNDSILFVEDIGERPYQIDRMMWQLKLAGVFERISGLMIGQFTDYEEDTQMYAPVYELIRRTVDEYDFPVCFDFPVGHVTGNYPLIHGGKATLCVGAEKTTFRQGGDACFF